jgi:hypothetical protein
MPRALAIAHAVTIGLFACSGAIHGNNNVSYNPVVKVPLHTSRVENQVFIQDTI